MNKKNNKSWTSTAVKSKADDYLTRITEIETQLNNEKKVRFESDLILSAFGSHIVCFFY